MKTILSLLTGLALGAGVIHAAEAAPVTKASASEAVRGFYTDQGVSANTTKALSNDDYSAFVRVGYQVSEHWGFDVSAEHDGLNVDGHLVNRVGGRLVARLPWKTLAPYTFIGGAFDLEQDEWRLRPGAGLELRVSKLIGVFAEGALDADLGGHNDFLFSAGLRWRF